MINEMTEILKYYKGPGTCFGGFYAPISKETIEFGLKQGLLQKHVYFVIDDCEDEIDLEEFEDMEKEGKYWDPICGSGEVSRDKFYVSYRSSNVLDKMVNPLIPKKIECKYCEGTGYEKNKD